MNPRWAQDPSTGKPVLQNEDGKVNLADPDGNIVEVDPQHVGSMLSDAAGTYRPATPDDLKTAEAKTQWDNASAVDKENWEGRQLVKTIADGVTAPVRLPFALGWHAATGIARALGDNSEFMKSGSPLEKYISGENIAHGITALGRGQEFADADAERARQLSEGAPWLEKAAVDTAGFLAGGELTGGLGAVADLGRGAEAAEGVGKVAGEAASLGGHAKLIEHGIEKLTGSKVLSKIGEQAYEGAGVSLAGGTEEQWIKQEDEQKAGEAQLSALGWGAFTGGAMSLGIDAMKALPGGGRSLAQRVFSSNRTAESLLDNTGSAKAAEDVVADVAGVPAAPGVGGAIRGIVESMKGGIEATQSAATGVPRSVLEKYGALRNTPEAIRGQHLWLHRDEIIEQAAKDFSEAFDEFHDATDSISTETRDLAKKHANAAPLLTGDVDTMASAGVAQIEKMQASLDAIDAAAPRGRKAAAAAEGAANDVTGARPAPLGTGKAVAELRGAYADTIDDLKQAILDKRPEKITEAIDGFKRRMDRVKVHEQAALEGGGFGIDQIARENRMTLARDAANNARTLLEDSDVWGKFGDAQRETNSRITSMLEDSSFVNSRLRTVTGKMNDAANYGRKIYETTPEKIQSFLDGLGTTKSQMLDGKLRDYIANARASAESIMQHWEPGGHAADLARVVSASERMNKLLARVDETVAASNQVNLIMDASSGLKGMGGRGGAAKLIFGGIGAALGGAPGMIAGSALGHTLTDPALMLRQAIALRQISQRATSTIGKAIGHVVSGGAEGIAAMGHALGEEGIGKVAGEAHAHPPKSIPRKFIAENVKERLKIAGMKAMEDTEGEEHSDARSIATSVAVQSTEDRTRRYHNAAARITALATDPVLAAHVISEAAGQVAHQGVSDSMVTTALTGLHFLASKLPVPVVAGHPLNPNELNSVSDSDRSQFMRYVDAVNKPLDMFKAMSDGGTIYPEQVESLKVVYPSLYQTAQKAVFDAINKRGGKGASPIPYQRRLMLAELFDEAGAIEPTLDFAFQQRIAAAAQHGQQTNGAQQQGKPPRGMPPHGKSQITASMQSPLDNLHI